MDNVNNNETVLAVKHMTTYNNPDENEYILPCISSVEFETSESYNMESINHQNHVMEEIKSCTNNDEAYEMEIEENDRKINPIKEEIITDDDDDESCIRSDIDVHESIKEESICKNIKFEGKEGDSEEMNDEVTGDPDDNNVTMTEEYSLSDLLKDDLKEEKKELVIDKENYVEGDTLDWTDRCLVCREVRKNCFTEDNLFKKVCNMCFYGQYGARFNQLVVDKIDTCNVCLDPFMHNSMQEIHVCSRDDIFECDYCGKVFTNKSDIINHLVSMSKNTCCVCCSQFCNIYTLNKHNCVQTNVDKRFVCRRCGKFFNYKSLLKIHLKTHTHKRYKCTVCRKIFDKCVCFLNHVKVHKLQTLDCKICNKSFKKKSYLDKHINWVHKKTQQFVCQYCNKCFNRRSVLVRHVNIHTKAKQFQCKHCSKLFNDKANLNTHVHVHFKIKPFACEHCDKSFTRKGHLKRHNNTHIRPQKMERKKYLPLTNNSFNQKLDLNVHADVNTDTQVFICNYCYKSFHRKSNLKIHINLHTNFKQFICNYCNKSFNTKSDLNRHVNIHTKAKQFVCQYCNISVNRKSNLNKHILNVHKVAQQFVCKHCNKSFNNASELNKHVNVHKVSQKFLCKVCNKSFNSQSSLHRHVKIHSKAK